MNRTVDSPRGVETGLQHTSYLVRALSLLHVAACMAFVCGSSGSPRAVDRPVDRTETQCRGGRAREEIKIKRADCGAEASAQGAGRGNVRGKGLRSSTSARLRSTLRKEDRREERAPEKTRRTDGASED